MSGETSLRSMPTISRAAMIAAERYGSRPALRYLSGGAWHTDTFAEVGEAVESIACGLVSRGIEAGDRVCLLANTRREWTLASLAISRAGAVVVPMYPTSSPEECEWVAGNSGGRAVICEDADQVAKIEHVRGRLDQLEWIASIEPADGVVTLDALREGGSGVDRSELERRCEQVQPDDPYTIIYTSGTTGPPKGVVLTHGNAASVGHMVEEIGFINAGEVSYLYLPLAHCFALTVQLASFPVGTEIVYFGGDMANLVAEMQATQPTYLPSVPRVFEKIYALTTSAFDDPENARLMEIYVDFVSQCRQTHLSESCAGRRAILRGVRGVQFLCARATRKYLRAEKGGQAGPHRRGFWACELVARERPTRVNRRAPFITDRAVDGVSTAAPVAPGAIGGSRRWTTGTGRDPPLAIHGHGCRMLTPSARDPEKCAHARVTWQTIWQASSSKHSRCRSTQLGVRLAKLSTKLLRAGSHP